ncbi:MAG: hypothetical protein K2I86_04085 [Prevotella sp.]|nr:hypothetical protein [Prevotella sp.]
MRCAYPSVSRHARPLSAPDAEAVGTWCGGHSHMVGVASAQCKTLLGTM